MNQIKVIIAVMATAALTLVANAQDSFSPESRTVTASSVKYDANGVQIVPPSYTRLLGYNGASTNPPSATGTNFVVSAKYPYQFISAGAPVNLLHPTIGSATTGWETTIAVTATLDRPLTTPAGWFWITNASQVKIATIPSNTLVVLEIKGIGTNVIISGDVAKK
jgi:hypothetical protein